MSVAVAELIPLLRTDQASVLRQLPPVRPVTPRSAQARPPVLGLGMGLPSLTPGGGGSGADAAAVESLTEGLSALLLEAVAAEATQVVRRLLRLGCDVTRISAGGLTALHVAVQARSMAMVKLVCMYGAEHEATDAAGHTPLHTAAAAGDEAMVTTLLQSGACVNLYSADGATPLHLAAGAGNVATCRTLLEHGADLTQRMQNGQRAVDVARDLHKAEVTALLRSWAKQRGLPVSREPSVHSGSEESRDSYGGHKRGGGCGATATGSPHKREQLASDTELAKALVEGNTPVLTEAEVEVELPAIAGNHLAVIYRGRRPGFSGEEGTVSPPTPPPPFFRGTRRHLCRNIRLFNAP